MPNGLYAPFLLRVVQPHPKPPEEGLRARLNYRLGAQICWSRPTHVLQIED